MGGTISNEQQECKMSDTTIQEQVEAAREILETMLGHLGFTDVSIEAEAVGDQIELRMESSESGRLIGRTSQTLDALQFLLNRMMSRKFEDGPYCVVDAAGYRARRREKLVADALEAMDQVRATGRPWRMPLLNAMDRRVIHQALRGYEEIETHSEDEDWNGRKRVVISLRRPLRSAPGPEDVDEGMGGVEDYVDLVREDEPQDAADLAAEDGAAPAEEGYGADGEEAPREG